MYRIRLINNSIKHLLNHRFNVANFYRVTRRKQSAHPNRCAIPDRSSNHKRTHPIHRNNLLKHNTIGI